MHCQLRLPHIRRSFPSSAPTPAPGSPASPPSMPIEKPRCGSLKNCSRSCSAVRQRPPVSAEMLKAPHVEGSSSTSLLTIFTQCEAPSEASGSLNVSQTTQKFDPSDSLPQTNSPKSVALTVTPVSSVCDVPVVMRPSIQTFTARPSSMFGCLLMWQETTPACERSSQLIVKSVVQVAVLWTPWPPTGSPFTASPGRELQTVNVIAAHAS